MATVNGVNVDRIVATVNAIKAEPDLARFRFRSTTEWVNGGHSRTHIKGFYGAGEEDISRNTAFTLESDEPFILSGSNLGPNAVEAILYALASCLAVGFAYNAAIQKIKIDALDFTLEGEIDLHGFLGLSEQVKPGYQHIHVFCRLKSDASREKLLELCEYVERTSPVLDIIRNPVPVTVTLQG